MLLILIAWFLSFQSPKAEVHSLDLDLLDRFLDLATELVTFGGSLEKVIVSHCTVLLVGQMDYFKLERPYLNFNLRSSVLSSEAKNLTRIRLSFPCTIAMYFIDEFSNLETINDWWMWRIPGGLDYSYHFIFPRNVESLQEKNRVIDLMRNFVIVIPQAKHEFALAHPGIFWEKYLDIIGAWNSETGKLVLTCKPDFFLNRWMNYKGAEIIVARNLGLTESEIDSYREDFEFVTPLTPLYIDVYDAMNATLVTLDPDVLDFGRKINGTWTGALKLIHDSDAHLTIFMGINSYSRWELVIWSPVLFSDRAIFLIALPKKAKGSLLLLAAPFDFPVWGLTVASILLVVLTLRVVFRGRKLRQKPLHLQFLLRMLLDQAVPFRTEYIETMKVKIIFATCFFSVMVLSVGYKCKLVSIIITPIMAYQPTTFPELVESHFQVGAISYTYGLLGELIRERKDGDELLDGLATKIQPYNYRDQKCYLRVLNEEFVCMGFQTLLNPFNFWFLSDRTGAPLYHTSRDHLFSILAGIGFSRKFPHVREKFGRLAEACMIGGLDIMWNDRVRFKFQEHGRTYAELRDLRNVGRTKPKELSQLLLYLISVLIFMVSLGCSAFLIEQFICVCKKVYTRSSSVVEDLSTPVFIYVR